MVLFPREENIVVGVELFNRTRIHTKLVFKAKYEVDSFLSLIKAIEIPYEVFIIVGEVHIYPLFAVE